MLNLRSSDAAGEQMPTDLPSPCAAECEGKAFAWCDDNRTDVG